MKFSDQVELFSTCNIFISRVGSSLINLLWIPPNSIVFNLDHGMTHPDVFGRICRLTNSKYYYMDYNNLNMEEISKILN